MKITPLLACCLALFLAAAPRTARAEEVSFDFFYNALADDGDWYNTPDYGYVWQPSIAYKSDKWRPYSDGYWAQTEDGWTWIAYENFGWATYHYGRWTRLEDTGWVWVPGYEWGPGWVSWRTSDDVVGWAPLPPKRTRPAVYEGKIVDRDPAPRASVSIGYNDVEEDYSVGYTPRVDEDYDIGPDNYCFVETRSFGAPVLSAVLLPPVQNITYVENTVNVTNIVYRGDGPRRVIYNNGPDYAFISRRSERPVQQLRIERRDDLAFVREGIRAGGNSNRVQNGVFIVAAPTVARREVNFQEMRPARVRQDLQQVRINRGWQGPKADPQTITKVREQIKRQANEKPATQNVGSIPPAGQQFQAQNPGSIPPNGPAAIDRNSAVPGVQPRAGTQGPALTDAERTARRDQRESERQQRDAARTGGQPAQAGQGNPKAQPTPTGDPERDAKRATRQQARAQGQQPPVPAAGAPGQSANTDPQAAQEREARRAARQQGQQGAPKAQPTPTGDPERDAKRAARQQARTQGQQPPAAAATPDQAAPPAVSDQEREARRAARQHGQQQPKAEAKPQPTPTGDAERDAKRAARQQSRAQQEQKPAAPAPNPQADQERAARQAARQQQQSQQADQDRAARQAARQQQAQPQAQPQRSDEERAARQAARQQQAQPQAQPQRSDEERAARQAARQQQKQEQPKGDDDKKKKGDGSSSLVTSAY